MTNDDRVVALGLALPPVPRPVGGYVNAVRVGELLFLSGHAPMGTNGVPVLGKLGASLDVAAGFAAARLAGLGVLATLCCELGSLDRVRRMVRVFGVVNATPEFTAQTQVINGASELFLEVFGDAGRHARLAVGVASLPFDIALEVEAIVQVWGDGEVRSC